MSSQTLHCVLEKCVNTHNHTLIGKTNGIGSKSTDQHTGLGGIDGEPVEFEWMIVPRHTTLQILQEIHKNNESFGL